MGTLLTKRSPHWLVYMNKIQVGGYLKGKVISGYALVDDEDYERLNKHRWYRSGLAYASRWVKKGEILYGQRTSILMHREVLNFPKSNYIDHINGDGLDNRKENLRLATAGQNGQNSKLRKDSTTGYKGVYWNKQRRKWFSQVRIGCFDTKEEAVVAYNKVIKKIRGKFAWLNKLS